VKSPRTTGIAGRIALAGAFALIVAPSACSDGEEPETLELASTGARVTIVTEPFELRVRAPDGKVVLGTLPSGGTGAYETPAAAIDVPDFAPRTLQGWDGYVENVSGWFRSKRAVIARRSESAASVLRRNRGARARVERAVAAQRARRTKICSSVSRLGITLSTWAPEASARSSTARTRAAPSTSTTS
jgi:hypothetical protein